MCHLPSPFRLAILKEAVALWLCHLVSLHLLLLMSYVQVSSSLTREARKGGTG